MMDAVMVDKQNVIREYKRLTHRNAMILLVLCALLLVMVLAALCVGASSLTWNEVLSALFHSGHPGHGIVMELRLPRIVMALLVGSGLALAGAVFQAILRNPLASPYTLGMGSSAGFGAVLVIVFMAGAAEKHLLIAASAFVFTLISSALVLAVSRMRNAGSETMILAGIALMFFFSAMTSLFQYMGTMEQVAEIVFWFFGNLGKAGWLEIGIASLMIFCPMPFMFRLAPDFNLLAAGDETAKGLGVHVTRVRMTGVILSSLITAGAICFTGVIGFVGLVAPHIMRMVIGADHRFLLPASAMAGAVLVLAADTLGRTLWAPQIIPIGIVTSFTGVPFFVYLLMRRSREYWS